MSGLAMIIFPLILLAIAGGGNLYIGLKLYQWLVTIFPNIDSGIYIGVFTILAVIMILGFMSSFLPFPVWLKRSFSWISVHWMGIFVYLLLLYFVMDIILLAGGLLRIIPDPVPQSVIFYSGLNVVLITTGLVSYGLYKANRLRYVFYDLQPANTSLNGMKLVLISDSHLGAVNNFERDLEKIVQAINDMKPDLVCWTGDIFNGDYFAVRNPDRAAMLLGGIESAYGVYACPGNHDAGASYTQMSEFLKRADVTLLSDEYAIIDDRFVLIGRSDSSPIGDAGGSKRKDISDILSSVDADLPIIVMDHNPGSIRDYGSEINLILTGHTHKGQMFPFSLITRAIFDVDHGHYQKDKNSPHVIVTSGVSTWGPPLRIGTNNEIVCITL